MSAEIQRGLDALTPEDSHAAHRCRLALKRVRGLVLIAADASPGLVDFSLQSIQTMMASLASAQDLSAQACIARAAAARTRGKKKRRALQRIADSLETLRQDAEAPDFSTARVGLRDLLALALVWPEVSERQVRRGAKALARRARRARRRGLGSSNPLRRHDWRIREKDRLLAAELLGKHWPKKRKVELARRLTHLLGQEHDLHLLMQRVATTPPAPDAPKRVARASAALTKQRDRIAAQADALGELLRAEGA